MLPRSVGRVSLTIVCCCCLLPSAAAARPGATATPTPASLPEGSVSAAPPPWADPASVSLGADEQLAEALAWRNIGPFRAGAWISDIALPAAPERAHRYTFYVAARNGGLWRTRNNGTTFEPIFDTTEVAAIGAVAVAPSDGDVVWVGTGGNENARSTYRGNGVYRSTDGGDTWRHVGLEDTHHIARIVVHPQDPDTAWVAALGHLFSANEQRGVFKTTDGGATWRRVLYVNDNVGAVDLVMAPGQPAVLYAAMYEKYRYPWHFEEGGPNSGIYKSSDGGDSWQRLGGGLPTGKIGRIGLDVFRGDPRIVYAVVENANLRPPLPEEIERARERGEQAGERVIGGEVYRSDDAGRTWRKMNRLQDDVGGKAAYSFNQIRVHPTDPDRIYVTTVTVANSADGGRTWHDLDWPPRELFPNFFGDVRTLWIDPLDPERIFVGTDGGLHVSYDGGRTSDFYDNLPLGEVYAVGVDSEHPYHVYAGLQDHDSWKGPVNSWSGAVSLEDWVTIGSSDGMFNVVDPSGRWVYNTQQFGGHKRVDQSDRTRVDITPRRPEGQEPYRFTWTTPLHLSPHDPDTIYTGAQVLLRSRDRGEHWQEISPDLTHNDPVKIAGRGHIQYCTITTIAESPLRPGLIWVGTDDGRVWVTRDGGGRWLERTAAVAAAGGPEDRWVSRVFASPHAPGTAFVAKSGYRRDDFRPFLYRTDDYGETWVPVSGDLPQQPINVIVQDREEPELLFVGNDLGVYVSLDGGAHYRRLPGLPPVPVRDLTVHPREADLVVGTYGRGIWIADVSFLRQATPEALTARAHLFTPEPYRPVRTSAWGNYELYGDRHIRTPNEPRAAALYYRLAAPAGTATIGLYAGAGEPFRTLSVPAEAGLHRVLWDLRDEQGRRVPPGRYGVVLQVDGVEWTSTQVRLCSERQPLC